MLSFALDKNKNNNNNTWFDRVCVWQKARKRKKMENNKMQAKLVKVFQDGSVNL